MILKDITPHNYLIITTCDRYGDVKLKNGLIDSSLSNSIKPYQKILFLPSTMEAEKGLKVGDLIGINVYNFARPVQKEQGHSSGSFNQDYSNAYKFEFPTINIDGKDCIKLSYRDIDFVINDYELEDYDK
jgi:hypothetical protein